VKKSDLDQERIDRVAARYREAQETPRKDVLMMNGKNLYDKKPVDIKKLAAEQKGTRRETLKIKLDNAKDFLRSKKNAGEEILANGAWYAANKLVDAAGVVEDGIKGANKLKNDALLKGKKLVKDIKREIRKDGARPMIGRQPLYEFPKSKKMKSFDEKEINKHLKNIQRADLLGDKYYESKLWLENFIRETGYGILPNIRVIKQHPMQAKVIVALAEREKLRKNAALNQGRANFLAGGKNGKPNLKVYKASEDSNGSPTPVRSGTRETRMTDALVQKAKIKSKAA